MRTLTRAQPNQILLRWEPTTEPLWTAGIRDGYYVERKVVSRNNAPVTEAFTRLMVQPLKPASASTWTPYLLPDSVQHQTLYRLVTGQDTVATGADSANLVRQEPDSYRRFFFGLLAASQSYSAARLAALGYIDASVQSNERYAYRVVLAVPPVGVMVDYPVTDPVGLADYRPLSPPMKPKLSFERYYADLKWLHDTLQSPYVSYWIERSVNGTSFKRVNDRPFVSLDGATNLYAYKDPVPKGRRTYYYRIVGKTPFDEINGSLVVSGQSKDTLVFAPRIKTLRLQSDNRVYMTWQFPGDTALSQSSQAGADSLLKSFFISVAAKPADKPVTVKYNINPTDTLAYIDNYTGKVPGGSTLYFTVGAVRLDGDSVLSASLFVEPVDTIPPAAPTGLKGYIGSNGQVYLSWQPNEEPDLLGYKVFRSQRSGEEASAVSDTMLLLQAEFSDSLLLNNLNPALYYQVKALDTHYNTSKLSLPLQLLKPDIVRPAAPLFLSDTLQNGQLRLTWAPSSSPDVVRQLLLRRESDSAPWQLLTGLSPNEVTYVDADIQPTGSYHYLLLAQDAAGLNSDSTAIRRIEVPASQGTGRPVLAAFNARPDPNLAGIRLSWSYNGSDVSEYQLYRATDAKPFGLWRMVSRLESATDDEGAISSGTYRYKIQAVYKDGSVSNWQSASATVSASSTVSPGASPYVVSPLAGQQATVNQPFTYVLPDSVFADPEHVGITTSILAQGLPNGLTATGPMLSGIPLRAGTYTVTVQGSQSDGYLVTTTFSLTVNQPPASVSGLPNLTVTIGQSFTYTLPNWVFTDADSQIPQVSILSAGLPNGLLVTGSTLQGTLSNPGPYTLTAQAQDSQEGTSTVSWLLIGNQPPQVQTPLNSFSALIGRVVAWTLPAGTFTDPDGQLINVRIRAAGLPPGLAVHQNQLLGVPTTTGTYTLTVIATDDGGATAETTAQVQIGQATNQPPVVTMSPPQIEGMVGDSLTYTLPEGLFFDPDGRITGLTLTGPLPTGLSLSGLTIKGTPTQSGTFTLTATATDDRGSSVSSPVLLTSSGLSSGNLAPIVVNTIPAQQAQPGKAFSYTISSAVFADPNGDLLTYTISGLPAGLSATGLSITGAPSVTGTSTITVTATDPGSLSISTTFTIRVNLCLVDDPYILTGTFSSPTPVSFSATNRMETDTVQPVVVNSTASLTLTAGQLIQIKPGFVIKPGATFRAYNKPCN
ncbi:putative Ig domain-containing protein [Spirosoma areae]